MRMVCPSCGAIASLEAWENDPAARQYGELRGAIPYPVSTIITHYLGLFRKGGKALRMPIAVRHLRELKELIDRGTVQWDGGETRPAPPELWAEGMQITLAKGVKELENHNYLRRVVWDKARGRAVEAERSSEAAARSRAREPEPEKSEEEMVAVKDLFRQFGQDPRGFASKLNTEKGGK